VLLGREIGGLEKYDGWIAEATQANAKAKRKSHLSGKDVFLALDGYQKNARFISADELEINRSYALGINDIKDIDSIARALREKCEYTGNRFLGNSAFVSSSDIIIDSQYVCNSTNIEQSTYVHSSFMVRRGSKYAFGSGWCAESEFLIRLVGAFNAHRCLENYITVDSSDMYFCHNCAGCQDLMFSFGQRNKRHMIGNLALPKEKYRGLKAKLISEIADELEKNKRFPSLIELAGDAKPEGKPDIRRAKKEPEDMGIIEKGFFSTYKLILKREPAYKLTGYENWLSRHTVALKPVLSPFGAQTVAPQGIPVYSSFPPTRRVTFDESISLSALHLEEKDLGSMGSLQKALGRIAFFTAELRDGVNRNVISSPLVFNAVNVYKGYDATYTENCAVCSLPLNTKYAYGCHRALESQFSLKCYNSLYLNRCFEMDSCTKCSDSYFCHNSEALSDCMFCFNMKGRRFHIGNTEFGRGEYARIKESLVGQMADELARRGGMGWDIYNIGAMQ